MKDSSKIMIALGAGLAVGGLLGVLFAPDKGSETRKRISDTGKKLAENAKMKFGKGKEMLNNLEEKAREEFSINSVL